MLDGAIKQLVEAINTDVLVRDGELNYVITNVVMRSSTVGNYKEHNANLGVLDAVAREYYRRVVAPYEDLKILENGDIAVYE